MKKTIAGIVAILFVVCAIYGGVTIFVQNKKSSHLDECEDAIKEVVTVYEQTNQSPNNVRLVTALSSLNQSYKVSSMEDHYVKVKGLCADGGEITFVFNGDTTAVGLCSVHESKVVDRLSEPKAMYYRFMYVLAEYKTYYRSANIDSDQLNASNMLNAFYRSQSYNNKNSWPKITIEGKTYALMPRYNDDRSVDIIATSDLIPYDKGSVKVVKDADYVYDLKADEWVKQ